MGIFNFFRSNSININNPFPKDKCTSLVIYAGQSYEDAPDDTYQSFIRHDFTTNNSAFVSDVAPYLTVLESKEMLAEIRMWKDKAINNLDHSNASDAEQWLKKQMAEKNTHFMYELEPQRSAGKAYPWAIFQEKKG